MELRINDYQVTPEITFNFDEIKAEISDRVSFYKDLVYTDDEIKQAKADRARLRKLIDAIDSQRKQVKADILAPYDELEKKLNEIKALIQEPINMIDNQVKAYEELQKQTKTDSIHQGWINKGGPVDISLIWNPKWLNSTYSMKKISEEMDAAIEKFENGMVTLEQLTEYQFEAIEVFKATLDLGAAMVRANELKEQAKRKAEYEAQKKAEAEYQNSPQTCEQPIKQPAEPPQVTWPEETEREWVTFTAFMSVPEALELKRFFDERNIEFKKGE